MLLIISGLFSFGIASIMVFLISRQYPKTITPEGVTKRNGKFLPWSNAQEPILNVVTLGGVSVTKAVRIPFGDGVGFDNNVGINPGFFNNGQEAVAKTLEFLKKSKELSK